MTRQGKYHHYLDGVNCTTVVGVRGVDFKLYGQVGSSSPNRDIEIL